MSTADPLSQNLHFNKTPGLFLRSLKSEEHWPTSKFLTQQVRFFTIWPHASLSQAIFCQFLYVSYMPIHFWIILYSWGSEVLMLFPLSGLPFLLFWLTGSINLSTQSSIPQIYYLVKLTLASLSRLLLASLSYHLHYCIVIIYLIAYSSPF